jgi:hypothetical protein
MFIGSTAPGSDMPPEFGVSAEFVVHYRDRSKLLEDVSLIQSFTSTIRVHDRVERVRMAAATYQLFSTLGAKPVLGTLPGANDAASSAVISHVLWQTWFDGRDDVIGQTHFMGDGNRTIVGVLGPDFRFPSDGTLLWITNDVREAGVGVGRFGSGMVGRAVPGVTPDEVAVELTALSKELPARFGGTAGYARLMEQYRAVVRPLAEQMLGPASRPL